MSKLNSWRNSHMLRLGLALAFGLVFLIGLLLPMSTARSAPVATVQHAIDGDPRPQNDDYNLGANGTDLVVIKQASPDPVQAGAKLTYTIRVTNTSSVDLHATITDTLPTHIITGQTASGMSILPGGTLT
ncbi:MAG: DUF11 domain-containing protein, partial [Chloroflexi bacterium]|nr:DUF11 domain-containing protein [Chloroflexota bacterium]